MPTDVIVLNGGSSAGKTSIARALLAQLPGTWLTLGVDDLVDALGGPGGEDSAISFGTTGEVFLGATFRRAEAAWWVGVAEMARAGVGIVLDEVFLGGGGSRARLAGVLADLEVLWIGVHCPAGVAAARETTRADRVPGMAASQAEIVHRGVRYDLEVDTSRADPARCAAAIAARVDSRPRDSRPVVVDADPSWPDRAAVLVATLLRDLGPLARRVEHIGSTAIPGMAAKAVLDLQISVEDLDASAAAFATPLRALGFEQSGFTRDRCPAGLPAGDPRAWAKRLWTRRTAGEDDVNLHVRRVGAPNERLALLFRDWFRAHPAAVPASAAFKGVLASLVEDTGTYADAKDLVVDLVVVAAEEWARATGWCP